MSVRDMIDQFAEAFGAAVADIRHELVDRGWFGRDRASLHHSEASLSDSLGWTTHAEREARGWQEPTHQRGHDPDRDAGLDR